MCKYCIFAFTKLRSFYNPSPSVSVCSSRAESKCSQRQQKALSSTVRRLSDNLKQLQQENLALREELNTDTPAGGIKGSNTTKLLTHLSVPEIYFCLTPFISIYFSFYSISSKNNCFCLILRGSVGVGIKEKRFLT